MSITPTGYKRVDDDHFHPQEDDDPAAQRRRRGRLEQIDYTAFACNREVVSRTVGRAGPEAFQALALAAAQARGAWVGAAFQLAQSRAPASPEGVAELARLRTAFSELSEAYEAARRMVERGYLSYEPAGTPRG